ncbi:hypothetical protein A3SI_16390 [Nitritalea halalkaliphila LW7]|uniref:HTH marR-type domain-containing protein n=1 Tax=Nitritalea halalkaliphila LW7 TaxID=1189621 RepID=I5BXK9_9BACT|nr:MarR family transcriptional regulator [Nitritalea halalkaliphila]EIM74311.1 hypothetical protein A3SI_16390 [Nitritalea halalkaliphila LW7]
MEHLKVKIEEQALLAERLGLTPAAAKLYTYLMYKQDAATFEELISYFNLSKSAVSIALNMLIDQQLISFRQQPGKRKRFFYLTLESWTTESLINHRFALFMQMLDTAIATRKENQKKTEDLEHVRGFYQLLLDEIPLIIQKWEEKTKAK